jgi:hypothetical protein
LEAEKGLSANACPSWQQEWLKVSNTVSALQEENKTITATCQELQAKQSLVPLHPILPNVTSSTSELESLVKQMELQVNKLQQENYELQSTTSNMIGTFSTLEEVIQHYSYLGEQQLVDFILDFEDKCTPSDQFIDFLATLAQGVHTHVTSQHDTFFQNIFPGSLHNLAS